MAPPNLAGARGTVFLEQLGHKLLGIEEFKVGELFSGSNEAGGHPEFLLDGHHDAALAAAVEFGDNQARKLGCLVKFAGLLQGIAAGAGIKDQQHLVRGAGVKPTEHTANFAQFLHEIVAIVQPACGVTEQKLHPLCAGLLMSIKADRCGVALLRASHQG